MKRTGQRTGQGEGRRVWAAVALVALLSACGGGGGAPEPGPDGTGGFTPGDAYSGPTSGARLVTPQELRRLLDTGEAQLVSDRSTAEALARAREQFEADRRFLESLPVDRRSGLIDDLLRRAARVEPFKEEVTQEGYRLLSVATQLRAAVSVIQREGSPENPLAKYRAAYQALGSGQAAGLPTPQSLTGRPLAEIQAAQAALSALLAADPDLDGVQPETEPDTGAGEVTPLAVPNAGTGAGRDQPPGKCTADPAGLYRNFSFPLKKFISPMKDQASRGTCWAFAAVGVLESRERVVSGRPVDLSEQAFNNFEKFSKTFWPSSDGDNGALALKNHLDAGRLIPNETFWRYNPSRQRNDEVVAYNKACAGYDGSCSETAHQSSAVCTTVAGQNYCGYEVMDAAAEGVASSETTVVYDAGQPKTFDLTAIRAALRSGHALIGTFGIQIGWQDAQADAANGFITDLSKRSYVYNKETQKNDIVNELGGGHQVQVVGFIANATMTQRLPGAPQASGGGYFIIKNSWGCSGDAGYIYAPATWVKEYMTLEALKLPEERSPVWKLVSDPTLQRPAVQITAPAFSQRVDNPPVAYIDVFRPVTLTGRVNDLQDGLDCCGDTLVWTATGFDQSQIGTGKTVTVTLPDYESTVTLTGRDSEGNTGQARLILKDAYPVVTITAPQNGAAFKAGVPVPFTATVTAFGNPAVTYDCANLIWSTTVGGDGTKTGCNPSFTFGTGGPRTVKATYVRGQAYSAAVNVVANVPVVNTAPSATILAPSANARFSADTPIILSATVGDAENGSLMYAWQLVLDPGTRAQSVRDIPGASGMVSGTRGTQVSLPRHSFRLSDLGAVCESEERQYELRLVVTDGFYPEPGLTTTVRRTIFKDTCKP